MRFEFHRFIGPLFRCVGGFKLKTAVGATVFSRGRFPRFFCFGPQPFQMISLISCHLIHLSGAGGRPHSANYRIVTFKSVPLLSLRLFSAFHFIFESGGREGGGERWGGGGGLLNFIQIYPANWLELHSGWFSSETGICCIFLLFLLLSLLLLLLLLLEMKIKRLKKKKKKIQETKQNQAKQNGKTKWMEMRWERFRYDYECSSKLVSGCWRYNNEWE